LDAGQLPFAWGPLTRPFRAPDVRPDVNLRPPEAWLCGVLGGPRSAPPLEHRLAPVIDTDRAPLGAIYHERREQIGELDVPTVLPRQPLDVVSLASPARFADDRQDRATDIGQCLRAIAGHDDEQSTRERSRNARPLTYPFTFPCAAP